MAFSGSMEVINKWGWVGVGFNAIISIFSLFGLVLVIYQRLITMLYLSSRNVWDTVYEIKDVQSSSLVNFAGFGSILKNVGQGAGGTGTDVVIGFVLGLLPNVKRYSDYSPTRIGNIRSLREDDGMGSYMLKTLSMTVLTIFFFAIGFSGVLVRGYGMVVDGMAAAADSAVSVNLDDWVRKTISSNSSGQFSFTLDDGSGMGAKLNTLSISIYQQALKSGAVITDVLVDDIEFGSKIQAWVQENVTAETVKASGNVGSQVVLDYTDMASEGATERIDKYWKDINLVAKLVVKPTEAGDDWTPAVSGLVAGVNLWDLLPEVVTSSAVGLGASEGDGGSASESSIEAVKRYYIRITVSGFYNPKETPSIFAPVIRDNA
jgi:hypothetical protein